MTGQTTIDGKSQPGAAVELDGSFAGPGVDGLTVSGGASIVRGLVINRFSGNGITLKTGMGIRLEANFVGTDATGNVDLGNGGAGVQVPRRGPSLGGRTPPRRRAMSFRATRRRACG